MCISDNYFDCPVAKRKVKTRIEIKQIRSGFPPVKNFEDCDGLPTCGVRKNNADGSSEFYWNICPLFRNLNN